MPQRPEALTIEVLLEAEELVAAENEIREKVRSGESVADLYQRYKRF